MDRFTQFEKDAWESTSSVYCDYFDKLTASCSDVFQRRFPQDTNALILDCACGPGTAIQHYLKSYRHIIGLDFSDAMIRFAAAHCPDTALLQADVTALPLESESIDVITMAFGLLHLAYPKKALHEFHRVCSRGGSIHFSVWQKPDHESGFNLIMNAVKDSGATPPSLPEGPDFFQYSDPDFSTSILHEIGFTDIVAEVVPLIWELPSVETFFLAFKDGTARTGALLRSQSPSVLNDIQEHLAIGMKQYKNRQSYAVPMPAIVFHAKKLAP